MTENQEHKNIPFIRLIVKMCHRKRFTLVISFLVVLAMIFCLIYYGGKGLPPIEKPQPRSWSEIQASGTLRAVTIESSFTAFQSNGNWYGYEYDNARQIADALGLNLEVMLVKSEQALADSLFTGAADVCIWPMSYEIKSDHWYLRPTGMRWESHQCIVSARRLDISAYSDTTLVDSLVAQLPHYRLSIVDGSRQWLVYHNDSAQKNFDFRPFILDSIPSDSLNTELLCDSMIEGKTDAVMLRCNVARMMHDYYPSLLVSDTIPFSQDSVAWMVTYQSDTLRSLIDSLASQFIQPGAPHYMVSVKSYRDPKHSRLRRSSRIKINEGDISPFDDLFKRHAMDYDLDWRLLAGIAYIESNFNHAIVSNRGPIGLMQLMPQTAQKNGYTPEEALDPDINVDLAAKHLSGIIRLIRKRCPDISDLDLMQFSLAGYNAGIGHLFDAINLADTLGYRIDVWANNVEHCLRLKSDPHYYRMAVVKSGRFNGAFTINYVNEVMTAYRTFCLQKPKEEEETPKHKVAKHAKKH